MRQNLHHRSEPSFANYLPFLQFSLGRLSDRFDRHTVLVISALATAGAAYGVIWTIGQPRPAIFIATAIFHGFCFSIYPLSTSQVNDLADPDRLVQVAAGMLISYGIGASIGPILGTLLMAWAGSGGFFVFVMAVNGTLAVFTIIRIAQRDCGDRAKARFMPLGGAAVTSEQLYTAAVTEAASSEAEKQS